MNEGENCGRSLSSGIGKDVEEKGPREQRKPMILLADFL